jgi:transposase
VAGITWNAWPDVVEYAIKILYWDRNGFCLWHKRLERDRFCWPNNASEARLLSVRELRWLLDGLSIDQAAHRALRYEKIC